MNIMDKDIIWSKGATKTKLCIVTNKQNFKNKLEIQGENKFKVHSYCKEKDNGSQNKLSLLKKQYWFKNKKNQYFPCVYEETSIKTRM